MRPRPPKRVRLFLGDREIDSETPTTEENETMATDPTIKITRLRITNFRGIASLDVPVGAGGAIFSGSNGEGKTTAIESINAALEGVGIGPEAIRIGSDKSEILVDLDKVDESRRTKLEVKRTIGKKSKSVAVTGSDGVPLPKPAEQLAALFGGRALDPLKFLMADAKEQRRIVLAANPVRVTGEDLTRWTGEAKDWNVDGHGQEVLARVRDMYFKQRTDAGKLADQAKAAAELKAQESDRLRIENPETMTTEAARTHVAAAERELAVLHERRYMAEKREAAGAETREKIAGLRSKAEELMARPEAVGPTAAELRDVPALLADAEQAFDRARLTLEAARARMDEVQRHGEIAKSLEIQATTAMAQANELEAAIATEDTGDLAALVTAAEATKQEAQSLVVRAESAAKWKAAVDAAKAYDIDKRMKDLEWERLDTIVKTLTTDAPAEIAKRADLIEGLEVTPDSILLDGKDITLLCGAEKMRFAVTLAKRVAGKARILTVDGLEQIAPSKQPEFVRTCLEGGWMLFATIVADGVMQVIDCYTFSKAAA
jgi:hypothetical protein